MHYSDLFALVGFFVGIVLHLFLLSLVIKRKGKERLYHLLIGLLSALMLWYAGNFISLFLRQMEIRKVASVLEVVDASAFIGLAFVPALLLHTHWAYYRSQFQVGKVEKGVFPALIGMLYLQLLFLPWALEGLFRNPALQPLQKLGNLQLPFLLVLALSYYACTFIQLRIVIRTGNRVEASLFRWLAVLFALIPLFNFWVFESRGGVGSDIGIWVYSALLASLLPTFVVAYYIYWYQFLQISVHRMVTSAFLTLAIIVAYLLGIRSLGKFLQEEVGAPPLLLEATLLVTLLLFFPTLADWFQNRINRGLTSELQNYRRIAEEIGRSRTALFSLDSAKSLIEEKLKLELGAEKVRLHLDLESPPNQRDYYRLGSGERQLGYLELILPRNESAARPEEGIRLLANEIAGLLERARLIDNQMRLERELTERTHLQQLGVMAANVAHNVKNPLSSIKTLLQLQQEAENLTEDQKEELGMMVLEVDRLSKTVSSLLKFSRMDQDSGEGEQIGVNLVHLVDSLATVFKGDLESYGLQLEKRVETSATTVHAEPDRLKEILSNIFKNAIEASPEKGKVLITLSSRSEDVSLTVEDEGPGIPSGLVEEVTKPFFTTKSAGSGLGLAIAKHHMEQLGGKLEIKSPLAGQGTRICLIFPIGMV